MKLKRFALRGLIVLFVAVALCMFFARTVQTITTPKVQLVQSTSGRFEDKMTFRAQIYFAETEEFTVEEAKDMNITVDKLYVRAGNYVKKGDIIFTAKTPSYEEEIKKVREDYDAKNKELLELDVQNRKLSKESYQNTMYQQLLDAQDTLSEATYEARYAAAKESVVLTGDVSTWQSQLALSGEVSDDLKAAVNKARTAQAAYEEARAAYFAVLDNKKLKVSDDVFQYITKRNSLMEEIENLNQKMVTLTVLETSLKAVVAPRDGYIIELKVAEGDTYDGTKVDEQGGLRAGAARAAGQQFHAHDCRRDTRRNQQRQLRQRAHQRGKDHHRFRWHEVPANADAGNVPEQRLHRDSPLHAGRRRGRENHLPSKERHNPACAQLRPL